MYTEPVGFNSLLTNAIASTAKAPTVEGKRSMALRETEGSRYTLRDTPIFTCVRGSLKETLDTLGG